MTVDIDRKLATLANHIDHQRRMLADIASKLDRLLALHDGADAPEGVRTLNDGRVFMPGTGTLGGRTLSAEAVAALNALDEARPA